MALRYTDIPIPFVGGQNGSADASLIPPPELLRIENGEFDDRANIKVVDGMTTLPVTVMTGETAPSTDAPETRSLTVHKDELLLEAFNGIYRQQVGGSFALAMSVQNRKREQARCHRMAVSSIADAQGSLSDDWNQNRRPNAGTLGMDAAQLGGADEDDYTCLVWAEQYGTSTTNYQVSWQIRHKTSDALVGRGRLRGTSFVAEPRVVAFGGQFRIFALVDGDIGYKFIDPASTQNVTETMTKYTAVGNYTAFDVALGNDQFCISAASSAPAIQHFLFSQAAPTVLIASPAAATPATPNHVGNTYVDTGGGGIGQSFVVFYTCAASETTVRWYSISVAGVGAGPGAQAGLAANVRRCFPIKNFNGDPGTWPVIVDSDDGSGTPEGTDVSLLSYDAKSASPGLMASGTFVAPIIAEHMVQSQPVNIRGNVIEGTELSGVLLGVGYYSTKQFVYQVIDIARSVKTSIDAPGSPQVSNFPVLRVFDSPLPTFLTAAADRVCTPLRAPSTTDDLGAYFWCAKFTPNITNVTDLGQNPTNIQRNLLQYPSRLAASPNAIGSIEFANLTYFAGGCPLVYDGQDLFEEGFTFAPELSSAAIAGVGGPLSAGLYSLVLVYEWFDGQGNRWQSAPSTALSFTASAATTYTLNGVRTLVTSLKSGVQAIPYRTAAGGTVYYRDSPIGVTPLTDAALQQSELLYTGPGSTLFLGTQSNNALPGVKNFTEHQNRLVAVGGEYARGFFYSKERADRFPAEFNRAAGFGQVPDITGRIAAASSVDDKLLLFAENGLSVVFGQGPNNNWLQNGFGAPVRIQAAEGIRFDSPFIAEVPDGVWYVTTAGPRMLSRGLVTAKDATGMDLGDKLRTQTQVLLGQCDAVFTHPTRAQVWFVTDDQTFIFDYLRNVWTYRTSFADDVNHPFTGAAAARGVLYALSTNGMSTALRYVDPASVESNPLVLEFGWVGFAGVQRFQRFTHLQVTGTEGTKGTFTPELNIDLKVWEKLRPTTQVQSVNYDFTMLEQANTPWQVEFQMAYQQGTGYKMRLTFTPNVAKGGNFTVTSILARVGTKSGGARLPNSQRG
jgi:hypothetical protein